jgi:DNA recombination protein RmuC
MAILTSFQMGFHTLAIEKKGNEVWRVLATTKKEFENFGGLMDKMERQVGTVQNTIKDLGVRSRAIGRSLKNVASLDTGAPTANLLSMDGMLPMLPAEEED